MQRRPYIRSLLLFTAAAGALWAIMWFGLALIVLLLLTLPGNGGDRRRWAEGIGTVRAFSTAGAIGVGIWFAATGIERRIRVRREPRGFDMIPASPPRSDPPEQSAERGAL
jgi:hypothetical protein